MNRLWIDQGLGPVFDFGVFYMCILMRKNLFKIPQDYKFLAALYDLHLLIAAV